MTALAEMEELELEVVEFKLLVRLALLEEGLVLPVELKLPVNSEVNPALEKRDER